MRISLAVFVAATTLACGSTTLVGDGGTGGGGDASGTGGQGAGTTSAGANGGTGGTAGMGGGTTSSGGGSSCPIDDPAFDAPEVVGLCVRGESSGQGEVLTSETPVRIVLRPQGCFSSSCTEVVEANCEVVARSGPAFEVDGDFCVTGTGDDLCTPDCGGAGFATCDLGLLAEGSYTATLGSLSVSFTVPSTLPFGGECVGSPM